MTYQLLDTDGIIDYLFGIPDSVSLLQMLSSQGDILCTAAVVVGEIYAGLLPKHRAKAEQFLSRLLVLPTTAGMAKQAGEWKYVYARAGASLSLTDCLIAATAQAYRAGVVTGNLKDFPMPEVSLLPLPRP